MTPLSPLRIRQKMADASATTTDRTKLRAGYVLVLLHVLGFILSIVAIRSDLFHRAEVDSGERATTRVTLWKVIHCEVPAAAPSPNEKEQKLAGTTSTNNIGKKKNTTAANAPSATATSNDEIPDLTTQQCSYDTISKGDINWSDSMIQKFHVVLGFTILSLVCRCGLLLFVVVVGGNVLKLFRFLHHDDGNRNLPATATSSSAGVLENGSSLSVDSLAVAKGNARVLRMHTCEGFGVLICGGIHLLSQVVVLAVLLTLWTSASVAEIESALQLHSGGGVSSGGSDINHHHHPLQSNSTSTGLLDFSSSNGSRSSGAGFRGAGFSMRLGFVIWIFYGFFELFVTVFGLVPFSCVLKWGSRPAAGADGVSGSTSFARSTVGEMEQLEAAFLPAVPTTTTAVANDTSSSSSTTHHGVEMVPPAVVVVVDFDKSISREASTIIPLPVGGTEQRLSVASPLVYRPPSKEAQHHDQHDHLVSTTPSLTTAEKVQRIKALELELASLKGSLVDGALVASCESESSSPRAAARDNIPSADTSKPSRSPHHRSSSLKRTITESSI